MTTFLQGLKASSAVKAMFEEFLATPWGYAVICTAICVLSIIIIQLNYRLFFKTVLDFVFGLAAAIILSPLLIALAIISKVRFKEVFDKKAYLGAKGKLTVIRTFCGFNGKLGKLAYIFELLSGKMSIVGVKLMEISDGAVMSDEAMSRFKAKPGIFCHLAVSGNDSLTYPEMFSLDARYYKKRGLFYDIFAVLNTAVYLIRGEGASYLGETAAKSFCAALLEKGEISQADAEQAQRNASQAIEEYAEQKKLIERYKKF